MEVAFKGRVRKGVRRAGVLRNGALAVAGVLSLPVVAVVVLALNSESTAWAHLTQTVLAGWSLNTALLALGVAAGVLALGVPPAWLVTRYRFPARGWLEVLLVLPLAVPPYIAALALSWLLDGAGPAQSALRRLFAAQGEVLPSLHSLGGAVCLLSLALYPYVYLLARKAFLGQGRNTLEVAQCLGATPWQLFWKVALPIARPALVAGVALALMETLAEYGALELLGVQTWTTAIFRAWFGFGDLTAAARLSCLLLLVVALLMASEKLAQSKPLVAGRGSKAPQALALRRGKAGLAVLVCAVPPLLGFALPALTLVWLAWRAGVGDPFVLARLLPAARASAGLGLVATLLIVPLALLIAYALRSGAGRVAPDPLAFWRGGSGVAGQSGDPLGLLAARVVSLGYATPGAVIAIGVIAVFVGLSKGLEVLGVAWQVSWLTLSVGGLLFAYLVRFSTIALETLDAGLVRIRPSLDDAARGLGRTELQTLLAVHLPILLPSLLTASLIVFVEVLKELPATLLIRPFGVETLAVQAWSLADDERLADAALPALLIVATGLLPIALLMRITRKHLS